MIHHRESHTTSGRSAYRAGTAGTAPPETRQSMALRRGAGTMPGSSSFTGAA
jgi:hypothetical protein